MIFRLHKLLVLFFILLIAGCSPGPATILANSPESCPVTKPSNPPFIPPQPYPAQAPEAEFWYGTDSLWTAIPQTGKWDGLPHESAGFTQKVFWWSKEYSIASEPEPALLVTGRRIDAPAGPLQASKATNAFSSDLQSMLVGVDIPTLGCWEITGEYKGIELIFVVWVGSN